MHDSDTELSSQERPSPQRPDQPGPGHRTSFMITRLPVRPNVATGAEHAFPGRLAAAFRTAEPERLNLPFRTGHYVLALGREGACISTYRFGVRRHRGSQLPRLCDALCSPQGERPEG